MYKRKRHRVPNFITEQLEPRLLLSTTMGLDPGHTSLIPTLEDQLVNAPLLLVHADVSNVNDSKISEMVEQAGFNGDVFAEPIITLDLSLADDQEKGAKDGEITLDLTGGEETDGPVEVQVGETSAMCSEDDQAVYENRIDPSSSEGTSENFLTDETDYDSDISLTQWLTDTLLSANPPPGLSSATSQFAFGSLSQSQLNPIVAEAISQWSAFSLVKNSDIDLGQVTFEITDLSGEALAQTDGMTVWVDATAADRGWFVDSTPTDNSEFDQTDDTHLTAARDSEAVGRIDLLTVMLHEVGHIVGFGHDDNPAVMDEVLLAGQRILLSEDQLSEVGNPGDGPVQAASHTSPILDLSDALNNGQTITITVLSNGNVQVSDSLSGDDNVTTGWTGITEIIGNSSSTIILQAPNLDNVWNLSGVNSGDLTPDGLSEIKFEKVQNLKGGSAKDTFVIDKFGGVSGSIDDGAGILEIRLFNFIHLSGDFAFENKTNSNLILKDGTAFNNIDYQLLSGTGVDAFVGVNGPATNTSAIGFSLVDIAFSMLLFSDTSGSSPVIYTALKTTGGGASFVGITDMVMGLYSFSVKINRTSDSENPGDVLDFDTDGDVTGIPVIPSVGPTLDFEGEDGALLNVSGNAALDIFGAMIARRNFNLRLGQLPKRRQRLSGFRLQRRSDRQRYYWIQGYGYYSYTCKHQRHQGYDP